MWSELDKLKCIVCEIEDLYIKGEINKERFLKLFRNNVLNLAKRYSIIKADRHHMILFLINRFPQFFKHNIDTHLEKLIKPLEITKEVIDTSKKWTALMGKESTINILSVHYTQKQVQEIMEKVC